MVNRLRPVCLLTASVTFFGCDYNPVGPSALQPPAAAVAQSGMEDEHVWTNSALWTGSFTRTPNTRRPNAPAMLLLTAQGSGEFLDYSLEVSRAGTELPNLGIYPLQAVGGRDAFQVFLAHRRGNEVYRYAAHAGQLHITHSSPDALAGSFDFSGTLAQTCAISGNERDGDREISCSVTPGLRGPLLELKGAFQARAES